MLNAISTTQAFGVSNVIQDKNNLSRAATDIRTNNSEQLVANNVRAAQKPQGSKAAREERSERRATQQQEEKKLTGPSASDSIKSETEEQVNETRQMMNQAILSVATASTSPAEGAGEQRHVDVVV
ncbi:MAG: hypothetical protein HQL50_08705 [Magnetococcales bacterium]|nr:hypothetical protein [Magnetococcales bacterium]